MGYAQGERDIDDIVNLAQAEPYSSPRRVGEVYNVLGDLLDETMEEIEAASGRTDDLVGVPTGFIELDEPTNGLHPGQIIVVAARPAVGKSTLGIDIARRGDHPDADGQPVRLGALWAGAPAALVFLRHYG